MANTHSKAVRSYNMSRIRSRDTRPELVVRKYLFSQGFPIPAAGAGFAREAGYRDKAVIFVHGCFRHAHPGCRYAVMPKSNVDYWGAKIEGNRRKDAAAGLALADSGWRVFGVWECELRYVRKCN